MSVWGLGDKHYFFSVVAINITALASFRNILRKANEKLSQVLVDVLKTTAAAEETMGLHMQSLSASSGGQQATPPHSTTQRATWPIRPYAAGK